MNETSTPDRSERHRADDYAHREGTVAHMIEAQTARLPSDVWLWAALGSMGVSLALQLRGETHRSLFIGQWAAPCLLLGVYNKLVKVAGSDRIQPC